MLILKITPESGQDDRQADESARQLYQELRMNLEEGEIGPVQSEGMAGHRSIAEVFQNLIVTGMNLNVFAALFQGVKLWLESRPTAEVTITYPDGFTMKVSNLSLSDATALYEQHAGLRRAQPAEQ